MNIIRVNTKYDSWNNTMYHVGAIILDDVDELPVVGDYDDYSGITVESVDDLNIDIEQGHDDVWRYDYYKVITKDFDGDEFVDYYAVVKEEED